MAEMTLIFSGVKCDLCGFVWLASIPREMPEVMECPRCKNRADYDLVSLDDFKSKRDESERTSE